MQKTWVNLFHIYQPPWQERHVLLDLYQKSYTYLVESLEENPNWRLSLNISGSLTEKLVAEKKTKLIDRIRFLVDKGQLELVGSAMYHPILPLISEEEIVRQVRLNEECNLAAFKDEWLAAESRYGGRGFFFPEVAYSYEAAKAVEDCGFSWVIVDQTSFRGVLEVDWRKLYKLPGSNLKLYIRNELKFEETLGALKDLEEGYLVTASDGEIMRRRKLKGENWSLQAKDILSIPDLKFVTAGEYLQTLEKEGAEVVSEKPKSGSWRTTEAEEAENSLYNNWYNEKDEIHKELWQLTYDIGELMQRFADDPHIVSVRSEYDKALSSCTWWWVDGRDLGYSPSEVTRGLNVIINCVRTFRDIPRPLRLKYEQRYSKLIYKIWQRHWQ